MALNPYLARQCDHLSYLWISRNWQDQGADFLINRALRRPILSDLEWRAVAARALVIMKTRRGCDDDASTLNALMSRCNILRRLTFIKILERFLLLRSRGAAQKIFLYSNASRLMSERLTELAIISDIEPGLLPKLVIQYLDQSWDDAHANSYGYHLAPLLPLAYREGDSEIIGAVDDLVSRWLNAMDGNASAKRGFAAASKRLLDGGAWSSPKLGSQVLAGLGALLATPLDKS